MSTDKKNNRYDLRNEEMNGNLHKAHGNDDKFNNFVDSLINAEHESEIEHGNSNSNVGDFNGTNGQMINYSNG